MREGITYLRTTSRRGKDNIKIDLMERMMLLNQFRIIQL